VATNETTARGGLAPAAALRALVTAHLARPQSAWSLGTFGAVAEFHRDADEPAALQALSVVTVRGGICVEIAHGVVPLAYERATAHGSAYGVAFCLPRDGARGSARRVLTEIGPDRGALREADRSATLFDLGLGTFQCDCLVRVQEARDVARLRAACGTSLLEEDGHVFSQLAAMSPQRVFVSRLGRIEVFQSIPAPDGKSPEGPHTHVLPRLLGSRRTHAPTLSVPDGLVPCLELHAPEPVSDAFDASLGTLPRLAADR
jgi:Family of unknown function (DUF6925)